MYLERALTQKMVDKALSWYSFAADKGHVEAAVAYMRIIENKKGLIKKNVYKWHAAFIFIGFLLMAITSIVIISDNTMTINGHHAEEHAKVKEDFNQAINSIQSKTRIDITA